MRFFHIGCRVEEIEFVWRNETSGKEKWPTRLRFKSGREASITGEWHENVLAIESILTERELSNRAAQREAEDLAAYKARLEADIKELERIKAVHVDDPDPLHRGFHVIAEVVGSGRNYTTASQRDALKALYNEVVGGLE